MLASGCLTALCASAGGQEGCALAEQPEIDVLLEALLSSCFSVRDAALRVSVSLFLTHVTSHYEILLIEARRLALVGFAGDGIGVAHRRR